MSEAASDDVADALRDGEPPLGAGLGPHALEGQQTHNLATKSGFPSVSSLTAAMSSGDASSDVVSSM